MSFGAKVGLINGIRFSFLFFTVGVQAQTTGSSSVAVPQSSFWQPFSASFKSYNDSARLKDLYESRSNPKIRTYKGRQELSFGYRLESGWGLSGQLVQTRHEYGESELDKWAISDPNVTFSHPDFYKDDDTKVSGSLRYYVPYTDRSKSVNLRQWAYYLGLNQTLPHKAEIFNLFVNRVFAADSYKATDTRYLVENRLIYTKKFSERWRWGVGHWTFWEQHAETSPGFSMELVPQLDYMLSSKTFLGPRLSLPLAVKNEVYEGPKQVSLDNSFFEIYFQTSL
jgi:hypothetical protein